MFTGIIESVGIVKDLKTDLNNLHLTIECSFTNELKIDQSIAHNGVCLTVININGNQYTVTAIDETLVKTNLSALKEKGFVNLERAMRLGDRLDGHIVQGHVDQTAVCKHIENELGSWKFTFQYDSSLNNITIEKGSITVNGVSLTVIDSKKDQFSVAIIPYTYEHTNFKRFEIGTKVNLEFDVIGKYVARLISLN